MNVSILNKIYICIGIILFSVFTYSCKEDDHYKPDTSIVPDKTIMELMRENADLSTFVQMVEDANYATVLSSDQSFTVWAPENSALAGVVFENETDLVNFVTNHIARFTKSASGHINGNVLLQNTKLIAFKSEGSTYKFGDAVLISPNHVASNGILHILDEKVDYLPNIWEKMEFAQLDSIRDFLYPLTSYEFDLRNSEIIGFNPEGLPEYDSIFVESNPFWEPYERDYSSDDLTTRFSGGFYPVNREDSIYTMILPTNRAWIDAYERIFPYFVNNMENSDSVQRYYTQFAIVQDLVFRYRIDPDTTVLRSTRLAEFPDPAYLFAGAEKEVVSNGDVYIVDELRYKSYESWDKPIKIEGETYGTRNSPPLYDESGNLLFGGTWRTVSDELAGVSGNAYFTVEQPRTTTTAVEYLIPNILSSSYKITCQFVPDVYLQGTNAKKTKVRFSILQLNRETNRWEILASGGGIGQPIVPGDQGEVSATEPTTMVVHENFRFPYAFVNQTEIPIKIRIETTITSGRETGEYANRMGIDYLLLEPVID